MGQEGPAVMRRSATVAIKMTSAPAASAWSLVSVTAEDRLDIVTVRIEHKRSVIIWPPQTRRTIIGSARLDCCSIEIIHLSPTFRRKGGMLPYAVRVESINPEYGKADSVTDAVGPNVLRYLHHSGVIRALSKPCHRKRPIGLRPQRQCLCDRSLRSSSAIGHALDRMPLVQWVVKLKSPSDACSGAES